MRRRTLSRRAAAVAAVVVGGLFFMAILAPQVAQGHERVTVGNYLFVVGWVDEPPLVGFKNSLDLKIFNTSGGGQVPVVNAEANLTAKWIFGSTTKVAGLAPVFGANGSYRSDIIPTQAGIYSVNFTGRVGSQAVRFTQPLDEVGWPSSIEFPTPRPTPENLSQANSATASQASGAQQMATYALALGSLGLVLGAAALGVALISRRRHREG